MEQHFNKQYIADPVEKWLNTLLCMDAVSPAAAAANRLVGSLPAPRDCDLFLVNRDALFSFHALSEAFLQRVWALYTAAHYKSSPNDLQMLSDAPAHRLFVLLGPQKQTKDSSSKEKSIVAQLPDVLCVLQVAFEGRISQKSVQSELSKGNKASGDMIPWTIVSQFSDNSFAELSGARIVRIATHPGLIVYKKGFSLFLFKFDTAPRRAENGLRLSSGGLVDLLLCRRIDRPHPRTKQRCLRGRRG